MWERGELKEKGLAAFKANYWKCVLVALVLVFVAGGGGGASGRSVGSSFGNGFSNGLHMNEEKEDVDIDPDEAVEELKDAFAKEFQSSDGNPENIAIAVFAVLTAVMIAVMVAIVIAFAINAFLLNPVKLGCSKFFLNNLNEPAGLGTLIAGFEGNYMNVVKVLFFKDLYLFLWALIPIAGPFIAIVKRYEYLMIPYLLAEDPDMDKEEAFAESRSMMEGNKWNAFVLRLSFIGWYLLAIITFGILSVLYVTPYVESTFAALYDRLRYGYNNAGQDYIEGSYTDVNTAG
ncbi:MAG: DUF975 family protein [Lachnospiraceae bacterium]|nr:DUF975 family protein [Lachnospiraceae bacterium]